MKKNSLIKSLSVSGVILAFIFTLSFSFSQAKAINNAKEENSVQTPSENVIKKDDGFTIITVNDESALSGAYRKENRKFAAMATVEVTENRTWTAWMSGGDKEPHKDNYIIVAYSDDCGDTWVDPYMIIDDTSDGRMRDPVFWYAPTGELYLFFGGRSGTRLIKFTNPDGDINKISYSEVTSPFFGTILNKPIVTTKGEWLCSADPYDEKSNYSKEYVYVSVDEGNSWTLRGTITSKAEDKKYHEGTIIEKNDGNLCVLSRIESGKGGGVERAYSSDDGKTWTTFEANLNKPLIGPGSKCCIYKLKNKALLFVSNDSTSARIDLTAYYSEDDGLSWRSLLLDSRTGDSAYPDVTQDKNGNIYVIWDHSRSVKCEIRMARFTVDDLKEGAFIGENSKRPCVTKRHGYNDIVNVNTPYNRTMQLNKGDSVSKEDIICSLPTAISVTLDDGSKKAVVGKWTTNWFSTDYAGTYRFEFTPQTENNLQDMGDYFVVRVKVTEKEENKGGGCSSSFNGNTFLFLTAGAILVIAKRSKKRI